MAGLSDLLFPSRRRAVIDAHSLVYQGDQQFRLNCPYCVLVGKRPDTEGKLGINLRLRTANCFRCGPKGQHYDELVTVLGLDSRLDVALERLDRHELQHSVYDLDAVSVPLAPHHTRAWAYVRQRGLSPDEIAAHHLRLGMAEPFWGRVLLPTFDRDGVCVYITARSLDPDAERKYLNPKGSFKGNAVFRIDKWCPGQLPLLVEGAFSAIAAARRVDSRWCPLAVHGKTVLPKQAAAIAALGVRCVAFLFDAGVGVVDQRRVVRRLREAGLFPHVAVLDEGDPESCAEEVLKNAINRVDFSQIQPI